MKKSLALVLAGLMTASLAGCGSSNSAQSTTAPQASGTTAGETTVAETEAPSPDTIVIYTNNGSEGRDVWLVERAAKDGFKVQVVPLGASEVAERMIAEKNNALCDVTFGLNNIEYEKLKKNELLQTWKPDWVDSVDQELVDADGFYYPVTTTPLVLIGNADFQNMPEDWIDLTKDEYKGLYQLHGLGGGTAKTVYASIISRYADPNGELGISDEGWEIASKFIGNAHNIATGEDSIGEVVDGTFPLDEHWASGVLTEQKTRDYKFQIMTPEIGEPFVVESVAISAGTKKYEQCVSFLNWLGSSEIQKEWSDNFGTIPCQEDALASVSDDLKELMEVLKPQELDWAFISENIDAWVEKAELEFVQ